MKKRFRIIIIAFSVSFILMGGLSIISLERLGKYTQYSNDVDHTNEVIRNLYRLESTLKDLDKAERGYMLTFDTIYSNFAFRSLDSLGPIISSLKAIIADNKQQARNFILLQSSITLRVGQLRHNIAFVTNAKTHEPSAYYNEGRQEMLLCMKYIREMHNVETKLFAQRVDSEKFYQKLTSKGLNALLIFFFTSALCLFLLLIKELKKRMEYQNELQSKIVNLERSHSELEQIAYAASHDFQEPLRKIQVFSNRLLWIKKDEIDLDTQDTINRICDAAGRLQDLIEDIVILTELIKDGSPKQLISADVPLQMAIVSLNEAIVNTHATINIEAMPFLKINPLHIQLLFKELLDNSLKFMRSNIAPVITITSDTVDGDDLVGIKKKLAGKKFQRITIKDNGIGFENKFSDKMFHIFQRLHNQQSQYGGKGIGLAICQRVMANHDGYILAYGHPEIGATFKLYFPVGE